MVWWVSWSATWSLLRYLKTPGFVMVQGNTVSELYSRQWTWRSMPDVNNSLHCDIWSHPDSLITNSKFWRALVAFLPCCCYVVHIFLHWVGTRYLKSCKWVKPPLCLVFCWLVSRNLVFVRWLRNVIFIASITKFTCILYVKRLQYSLQS